jgi:membrane protein DedA with SNARE-associated domain
VLEWFAHLTEIVFSLGYLGVYLALFIEALGLPFPGDAAMAFYGFAAAKGEFHIAGVIVFSILGYMSGAFVSYWLSRTFGWKLIDRVTTSFPLFNQRSMTRTTSLMDRYGPLFLTIGRFLPGIRSVSSYAAGIYRMGLQPFFIYTILGVIAWCSAWILAGYWFGEHLRLMLKVIQSWLFYVTILLVTAIGAAWYLQKRAIKR